MPREVGLAHADTIVTFPTPLENRVGNCISGTYVFGSRGWLPPRRRRSNGDCCGSNERIQCYARACCRCCEYRPFFVGTPQRGYLSCGKRTTNVNEPAAAAASSDAFAPAPHSAIAATTSAVALETTCRTVATAGSDSAFADARCAAAAASAEAHRDRYPQYYCWRAYRYFYDWVSRYRYA